jgi:hypothetical protein
VQGAPARQVRRRVRDNAGMSHASVVPIDRSPDVGWPPLSSSRARRRPR